MIWKAVRVFISTNLPRHARGVGTSGHHRLPGVTRADPPPHSDLEKVRRIRHELKLPEHNPLLFVLKCMEVDRALLPELIRDEFKARTFFVLCNARASRLSKWVMEEIELVKQVTKRPCQTVVVMNLERDLQTELHKFDRLSERAIVFSHTRGKTRKSRSGFGARLRHARGTVTVVFPDLHKWVSHETWRGEWW